MTKLFFAVAIFSSISFQFALAQQASPPSPSFPEVVHLFEPRVFKGDGGGVLPYRLLKPSSIESGKKYPLVLFLHGAGERGDDNVLQLWHGGAAFVNVCLKRHPAYVIAPQCPENKKWVEVDWDAQSNAMPKEPSESLRSVFGVIEALKKEFPIDDSRMYGIGLSMGGYGVWDILERRPELLAAGVPICGGGDPNLAARFKDTPVWAFHGSIDPAVPVERSRKMIAALTAAGGHPLYTEYAGVEHNSWTQTFENQLMWDWLFAQHK